MLKSFIFYNDIDQFRPCLPHLPTASPGIHNLSDMHDSQLDMELDMELDNTRRKTLPKSGSWLTVASCPERTKPLFSCNTAAATQQL